jgi:hypothetical protein
VPDPYADGDERCGGIPGAAFFFDRDKYGGMDLHIGYDASIE